MGDRDWRPFVYGGLASCVAEFGNVLFRNLFIEIIGPIFLVHVGTVRGVKSLASFIFSL